MNWDSTVGFLSNFLAPQLEMERNYIRPPGSVEELQFLTSCSRCGDCKSACPEMVIELFAIQDGVKITGTPYLDFSNAACTFCNKCMEVCPTDALNRASLQEQLRIGTAEIDTSLCLGYQDVLCDYCVRACPIDGAINLIVGKPMIDTETCTGCGVCRLNCISEDRAIQIKP
ncbi:4Fe-4S dicluster domain-containing protein [Bacillus marasmi]|uniref:4Fe-4S dicluster domain-containing protein n=1 Tax=Bacillus marasmi TaxID=1926279 RepID=UPI00164EB6E5|nr:4Fe-4S dicluster domain-containing protein [Bacillus marasmi]